GTVVITGPATGDYTYTPNPDYVGPDTFTITVDDGTGTLVPVVVTVTVTPVDDPTIVTPPASVTLNDAQNVVIDLGNVFTDIDTPLTINATGLPPGLSFDPLTNSVVGTLTSDASQGGPYTVTITADDGAGTVLTQTWTVDVDNVVPFGVAVDREITPGSPLLIQPIQYVFDADGDVLVYASPDAPAWVAVDPVFGRIAGTVPLDAFDSGPITFTVVVRDNEGGITLVPITLRAPLPPAPPELTDSAPAPILPPTAPAPEGFREPLLDGGNGSALAQLRAEPESTSLNAPEIRVEPEVTRVVSGIASLGSTGELDPVEGIIVSAVNGAGHLGSTASLDGVDPAIVDAVNAIDALRSIQGGGSATGSFADFALTDPTELSGETLRFAFDDRGTLGVVTVDDTFEEQISVKTVLRDQQLFVSITDTLATEHEGKTVCRSLTTLSGETPLWLRQIREGFYALDVDEAPGNQAFNMLIELQDGRRLQQTFTIDTVTGDLSPGARPSVTEGGFQSQLQGLSEGLGAPLVSER
ncbi:MAG: putative Ig domain-containing protein, partial [Pseudomonadota bacterium]